MPCTLQGDAIFPDMPEPPPLSPPPRPVPLSLDLRVRLGGIVMMIGWLVFAFGGAMATMFVGNSTLLTSSRYTGELATGLGTVVASGETSSRSNGNTIVSATFVHEVDGVEHECVSFHDGGPLQVDARYEIEWPVGMPQHARIVGMMERRFEGWVGLVLLFPFAAVVLLTVALFRNGRRVRLMRRGNSAWGVLTAKEPTRTQVNGRYVHRLSFEFVDERGARRTATDRTHDLEFFDEQVARHVLFDEASGRSCLVELIPGRPQALDGAWRPPALGDLLRVLILPVVAIAAITLAQQFGP